MVKHRKIALVLHVINGIGFVSLGYIFFVMSQAFVACSSDAIKEDPSLCILAISIFFGMPIFISSLPLIALINFGKFSRGFLWVYSIVIAILYFPLGTIVGGHTLYYLKNINKLGLK